jgi:hypothetical protein
MIRVLVKKTGRVVEFDETKLPPATIAYFIQYGATQSTNDSHASVVKKDWKGTADEFVAAVNKEVDDFIARAKAGTLATRAPEDPKIVARRELGRMLGRELTEAEYDVILADVAKKHRKAA